MTTNFNHNQCIQESIPSGNRHRSSQIHHVRLANSKARIKPTASLSAFDKENSIEFPLDSIHYLYKQSNPNPVLLSALPYESICSRASIWYFQKKKKRETIFKIKNKKRKGKRKGIVT